MASSSNSNSSGGVQAQAQPQATCVISPAHYGRPSVAESLRVGEKLVARRVHMDILGFLGLDSGGRARLWGPDLGPNV